MIFSLKHFFIIVFVQLQYVNWCFCECIIKDFTYIPDNLSMKQSCQFLHNGTTGVCRPLSMCPQAITEMDLFKITPTTCGFEGFDPIVCCLLKEQTFSKLLNSKSADCMYLMIVKK